MKQTPTAFPCSLTNACAAYTAVKFARAPTSENYSKQMQKAHKFQHTDIIHAHMLIAYLSAYSLFMFVFCYAVALFTGSDHTIDPNGLAPTPDFHHTRSNATKFGTV